MYRICYSLQTEISDIVTQHNTDFERNSKETNTFLGGVRGLGRARHILLSLMLPSVCGSSLNQPLPNIAFTKPRRRHPGFS
jgi:aryl-alcohol dehydrogenase-like predicted oxidoreductase